MQEFKLTYTHRGLSVLVGMVLLFCSLASPEIFAQGEPSTRTTDQEEANKRVAQQIYDVWDGNDEGVLDELIAEDVVLHRPHYMGGTVSGLEAYKNNLRMVRAAIPDLFFRAHKVVAEDDKVVAYATFGGTHKGELAGIEPTGISVEVDDFVLYRFDDGKIAEVITRPDFFSLFRQLDAVEHPAGPPEK